MIMRPGMTFTIEPMINLGDWRCHILKEDGWTAVTVDGSLSAQFEHTVLVTETGVEVLTLGAHEALQIEASHFVECIDRRATPVTDGQAGLRVVRLLERPAVCAIALKD